MMRSGANVETALFICHTVGAFPYTLSRWQNQQLDSLASAAPEDAGAWRALAGGLASLDLSFLGDVDPAFALSVREDGRLRSFRAFLRRMYDDVSQHGERNDAESLARDLADELQEEYRAAQAEWSRIDRDLLKWTRRAVPGVMASAVAAVAGKMEMIAPLAGYAYQAVMQLVETRMRRHAFSRTVPMSVFVDLSRRR
jgi:hypothetical protein